MRIDDPAEREAWIERTAERLAPTLEGRIAPDRVPALLARLADLEVDRPQGDMAPGQIILRWLLEEQKFEPETAALLARLIPKVDWHALELSASEMGAQLRVGRTTLWRHRRKSKESADDKEPEPNPQGIPPHVVLKAGTRDLPIFRLSSLLLVLAWQRRHPWARGQGARAYPPTRLH